MAELYNPVLGGGSGNPHLVGRESRGYFITSWSTMRSFYARNGGNGMHQDWNDDDRYLNTSSFGSAHSGTVLKRGSGYFLLFRGRPIGFSDDSMPSLFAVSILQFESPYGWPRTVATLIASRST